MTWVWAWLIGCCIGSFANALRLRLIAAWRHNRQVDLWSRSHCPDCAHLIAWYDLIPLVSYIVLQGRCRHCGASIARHYPLYEIAYGTLAVAVMLVLDPTLSGWSYFVLFATLALLSSIDLEHRLLPDLLTYPLLWTGLLVNSVGLHTDAQSAILGAISGYSILWIITTIWSVGKRNPTKTALTKTAMGHGDFKLFAAIGSWLGWQWLPQTLLIAALSALLFGIAWIRYHKLSWQTPIPFGPFLSLGCASVIVWQHV